MMTPQVGRLGFHSVLFFGLHSVFFCQLLRETLVDLKFSFWSEVAPRMKLDAPTNPQTPNGLTGHCWYCIGDPGLIPCVYPWSLVVLESITSRT